MDLLVIGSKGQIGWELLRVFPPSWHVTGVDRDQLDLADFDSIVRCIRARRPDVIVNAAGYTAVDRAEDEPEKAYRINAAAVGVLGEQAQAIGAAVIHFSSDYVFDGSLRRPYVPSDAANPLNVYGRSKLAGEQALMATGASVIILRTSWVYSLRRQSFLTTVLDRAARHGKIAVVNDQCGSPSWCRAVARATAHVVDRGVAGVRGMRTFNGREGIYHLSCRGAATWFEFAQKIVQLSDLSGAAVTPITSAQYGAKASRPAYSVLDSDSTVRTFHVTLPQWQQALEQALAERPAAAAS